MFIPFEIPDKEVFAISSMPNIGKIVDKTFKKSRSKIIRDIANERKIFIAFNIWFLAQTEEQRELSMKNIMSTIDVNEFIDKNVSDRDLVIEAINRIRANSELLKDSDKK